MDWDALMQMGVRYGAQYFIEALRAPRDDDDPKPTGVFGRSPQAAHVPKDDPGCPVCRLHRDAAEARGLLEGLAIKCQDGSGIPRGIGGTVALARDSYAKAGGNLRSVAIAAPFLQADCVALARSAASLEQQLGQQLSPDQVDTIAVRAKRYWLECYELAYRFYTEPALVREGGSHGL